MNHWLMKTEPDAFSIDDLERVRIEPWTGVRNFTARNLMRDQMQVGDRVLFYHSSAAPSGVAGLATIVRTGVVDATQFEPSSKYYDPGSKADEPRWICVDVEFVEKLPRLVPLGELRGDPALDGMLLFQKASRLSVQPVSEAHYEAIVARARRPAPEPIVKPKAAKQPAVAAKKPAAKQPAAKKPVVKKPAAKPKKATAKKPAAAAKQPAAKPKPRAGQKR